jgi:hypothetical protein
MTKNIIRFVEIFLSISFVFLIFAVYRDIRINKLFNYSSRPEEITYSENIDNDRQGIQEYIFNFKATDNYLGAINLPIKQLYGEKNGKVVFRISDADSGKIIHENVYDYNFFRNFTTYIFGFPVIENSNYRRFKASLSFTSENNEIYGNIIKTSDTKYFLVKYVFPRKIFSEQPLKLLHILKYRATASAIDLNYIQVFTVIISLSLVILVISIFDIFGSDSGDHLDFLQLLSRVFKLKYSVFPFIASLVFLIAIPLTILMGHFSVAELLANYIWELLLIGLLWSLFSVIYQRYWKLLSNLLQKFRLKFSSAFSSNHLNRNFLIIFIFTVIILGFSKTYYLGGDDTRLFYLYPQKFLVNFASKVVSDTGLSNIVTLAPPIIAPFTAVMLVFKSLVGPLNLQSMMYAGNVICGLIFFYLLVKEIIPLQSKYSRTIYLISSFFYVFSTFNVYTLYNSKLLTTYLISLVPLTVYLFIRSIREQKPYLIFVLAMLTSIVNMFTYLAPWSYAAFITLLPISFLLLWQYKLRTVRYLLLFGILSFFLNFYWLVYLPDSSFFNKSQGIFKSSVISTDFRQNNERGIKTVSELNSVFYPLMDTYHKTIQQNFNWAYLKVFTKWNTKLIPFNFLYIGLILTAGFLIDKKDSLAKLYGWSLIGFLSAVYFFTVNITDFGTNLFVWLNSTIPGFVMFRNMYDKFAFAVAFNFALVLAISLTIVVNVIKSSQSKKYIIFIISMLTLLNAKPYLFGEYSKLPVWTTQNVFDSTTALNDDFLRMVEYISKVEDPAKYLILPLSVGNAFPIQDNFENNHYYNGVSPLLIFTGKNDFSGLLSFGDFSDQVLNALRNEQYDYVGELLQKFNIKYVIVNNTISEELGRSFVYSDGLYRLQDKKMIARFIGSKIRDFGQRYSLYEINKKFYSEKIYLSNDGKIPLDFSNNNVIYKKIDSNLYDIQVGGDMSSNSLVFLDPFLDGWKLIDGETKLPIDATHFVALGYANGWKLDNLKGNEVRHFKIYFKPKDYFWPSYIITISGYIFCSLVVIKEGVKKYKVWKKH